MKHKVKKIKFKKGKDSAEATMRKLATNFINNGKITTTLSKAKKLKSFIDRLVFKAKEKKESTKNILLKHLGEEKVINKLFDVVAPKFNDRSSGFVRVIKLGQRLGDGAEIARMEWVKPILEVQSVNPAKRGEKFKVQSKQKQKENGKPNKVNQTGKK